MSEPFRILTVCLGNICRSPTAEAALRRALDDAGLSERVEVDSAGTGAYHVGDAPDPRMVAAGAERGLDLAGRAREVAASDFHRFDLILAMDERNRAELMSRAPDPAASRRVRMLREFASSGAGDGAGTRAAAADRAGADLDVPDPYFGGRDGFAHVVDLVVEAADGVVEHVRRQLDARRA